MPQPLAAFVCSNPIFGQTVNPWSRLHGTGGSSGGEGALLACDGSALGFGSDIGGRYVELLPNLPFYIGCLCLEKWDLISPRVDQSADPSIFLRCLLDEAGSSPYVQVRDAPLGAGIRSDP